MQGRLSVKKIIKLNGYFNNYFIFFRYPECYIVRGVDPDFPNGAEWMSVTADMIGDDMCRLTGRQMNTLQS